MLSLFTIAISLDSIYGAAVPNTAATFHTQAIKSPFNVSAINIVHKTGFLDFGRIPVDVPIGIPLGHTSSYTPPKIPLALGKKDLKIAIVVYNWETSTPVKDDWINTKKYHNILTGHYFSNSINNRIYDATDKMYSFTKPVVVYGNITLPNPYSSTGECQSKEGYVKDDCQYAINKAGFNVADYDRVICFKKIPIDIKQDYCKCISCEDQANDKILELPAYHKDPYGALREFKKQQLFGLFAKSFGINLNTISCFPDCGLTSGDISYIPGYLPVTARVEVLKSLPDSVYQQVTKSGNYTLPPANVEYDNKMSPSPRMALKVKLENPFSAQSGKESITFTSLSIEFCTSDSLTQVVVWLVGENNELAQIVTINNMESMIRKENGDNVLFKGSNFNNSNIEVSVYEENSKKYANINLTKK